MSNAITVGPAARSAPSGPKSRPARYELSEPLRAYLGAKYLRETTTARGSQLAAGDFRSSAGGRQRPWRYVRTGLKASVLVLTAVLFALLGIIRDAHADSVVLAESGLVVGASQTQTFSFTTPSAGTLDVQLADLDWPSPLANLALDITSDSQVIGTLSGSGARDFTIGSAGVYYAHLTGQTTGSLDLGAYGLIAYFDSAASVPLPASVTLLLGGLIATAWSLRRRRAPADCLLRNQNVIQGA